MLEDLGLNDSERVLQACKAIGLDVVIDQTKDLPMLRDIERRGWFINPFRRDDSGPPATKR